jgi:capsid protein
LAGRNPQLPHLSARPAIGELQLQQVEGDRIGSPLEMQITEDYISGVTIDPGTGRTISYRIFKRTRTAQNLDPQEVSPDSFIHLWDPFRSDQYRGVTSLRSILEDAKDIKEWIGSEKFTGKIQSLYAAMVTSKDPLAQQGANSWEGKTTEGTPTQSAEWGKILKLAEGESISFVAPPSRPSGAFLAFIQTIIRKMAVSLDLPYGFMWDFASLGGVTARIEVQQAQRRIQYWQRLLLNQVIRTIRNAFIADGIAALPPYLGCQSLLNPLHCGNAFA